MAKKNPKIKKTSDPKKTDTKNPAVTKTAVNIFGYIKEKTGINDKKIDDWQKKWLSLPENRKKYAHLKDVPDIVGEEFSAVANDIIEFVQGKESGKSVVFKTIKENFKSFAHDPAEYLKKKASEGEKKIIEAKDAVCEKSSTAKQILDKAKGKISHIKTMFQKTFAKSGCSALTKKTSDKAIKSVKKIKK